jgi:hypothetical protein
VSTKPDIMRYERHTCSLEAFLGIGFFPQPCLLRRLLFHRTDLRPYSILVSQERKALIEQGAQRTSH